MRRILSALALVWAALPATAQDSGLRTLETFDAVRGWEGVGRLDIAGKGFCTAALIDETDDDDEVSDVVRGPGEDEEER